MENVKTISVRDLISKFKMCSCVKIIKGIDTVLYDGILIRLLGCDKLLDELEELDVKCVEVENSYITIRCAYTI